MHVLHAEKSKNNQNGKALRYTKCNVKLFVLSEKFQKGRREMTIHSGELAIGKLCKEDAATLANWLSNPDVLRFYEGRDNPFDLEKVRNKFFEREDAAIRCIVQWEGVPIGYIQYYEVEEEEKEKYGYKDFPGTLYGMDQFIGETDFWNRGIGTLLVNTMVDFLTETKKADLIVMDPQAWNERAIRCYEKCGFKKIRLLPKHEYHEGEYRDCWLIEYKAEKA